MSPCRKCENVYQSVRCCDVSGPEASGYHSLTEPQAQMGSPAHPGEHERLNEKNPGDD
ncbi:hypothetical protein [Chelativorans sp.]|uniref:hypothetical protein n=1 Tax=Chelativorans sp. TaxID=2203393 RepID=UPI002810C67A|nr:hypothetical protein [Chelativorans sp.]